MTENRAEIISRCHAKVSSRMATPPTEIADGVPLFLDQLVEILRAKQYGRTFVTTSGTRHGGELLRRGFTIEQVVREYGDVCQSITALAIERTKEISSQEFQLLNLCLDDAIAAAVSEFGRQRELDVAADSRDRATQDIAILSYELRNLVWSAALAFEALKTGSVGISGSTGAMVSRSLDGLRGLVDRSFAVMKIKGRGGVRARIAVAQLIDVVKQSVTSEAAELGARLGIELRDGDAVIEADLQVLAPIVANLVRNACRHTRAGGRVTLRSSATAKLVRIEVEDECGGLEPGVAATLFRSAERGAEQIGIGLDLALSRRGIESIGGTIDVRDRPGEGCVFTVELPRLAPAS